ncbi:hypothetical protein KP509_03G010300 [Ceratopteris richardii]|nr:hypothetical protein KP509_03G010300 [Ceratopteris richardii]
MYNHVDTVSCIARRFEERSGIEQLDGHDSDDFDFSSRFSGSDYAWDASCMTWADELFCNGQIRPIWHPDVQSDRWFAGNREDDDCLDRSDFQSSAEYSYSMLPASLTNIFMAANRERDVDKGFMVQHLTDLTYSNDSADDLRIGVDAKLKVARMARDLEGRGSSRFGRHTNDRRGRHVRLGSRDLGARITRSLSPPRVFHMDDDLPRLSLEGSQSFQASKKHGDIRHTQKHEAEKACDMPRGKGARVTLMELLHESEQLERRNISSRMIWKGRELQKKGKTAPKATRKNALWSRVSNHHAHHQLPRIETGNTTQQTFLPYRDMNLLTCLGLAFNRQQSVAASKILQAKTQKMK